MNKRYEISLSSVQLQLIVPPLERLHKKVITDMAKDPVLYSENRLKELEDLLNTVRPLALVDRETTGGK